MVLRRYWQRVDTRVALRDSLYLGHVVGRKDGERILGVTSKRNKKKTEGDVWKSRVINLGPRGLKGNPNIKVLHTRCFIAIPIRPDQQ
jgi:hypothetical protein